jgi:SAM-dependent methyltransferase
LKPGSFFDAQYERYPGGWGGTERQSQLFRYSIYVQMISRWLPHPLNVLDLGCGEGYVASRFKGLGAHSVIGVDLSKVAIERARQNYPEIEFYQCSITDIRWDWIGTNRSPDLVIMGEVLYYLDESEQRAAVNSIHQAIKIGAYVLVSVNIGPWPYFTRTGLYQLFREFHPIESRGIFLKSYHRHIERPLWNLRWSRTIRECRSMECALAALLRVVPIGTIDAISRRTSESEESIHVALFRKESL